MATTCIRAATSLLLGGICVARSVPDDAWQQLNGGATVANDSSKAERLRLSESTAPPVLSQTSKSGVCEASKKNQISEQASTKLSRSSAPVVPANRRQIDPIQKQVARGVELFPGIKQLLKRLFGKLKKVEVSHQRFDSIPFDELSNFNDTLSEALDQCGPDDIHRIVCATQLKWLIIYLLLCTADEQRRREVLDWLLQTPSLAEGMLPGTYILQRQWAVIERVFGKTSPVIIATKKFLTEHTSPGVFSLVTRLSGPGIRAYQWDLAPEARQQRVVVAWKRLRSAVQAAQQYLQREISTVHQKPVALKDAPDEAETAHNVLVDVLTDFCIAISSLPPEKFQFHPLPAEKSHQTTLETLIDVSSWETSELETLYAALNGEPSNSIDKAYDNISRIILPHLRQFHCEQDLDLKRYPGPAHAIARFVAETSASTSKKPCLASPTETDQQCNSYEALQGPSALSGFAGPLLEDGQLKAGVGKDALDHGAQSSATHRDFALALAPISIVRNSFPHAYKMQMKQADLLLKARAVFMTMKKPFFQDVFLARAFGWRVTGIFERYAYDLTAKATSCTLAVRDLTFKFIAPKNEELALLIISAPSTYAAAVASIFNGASSMVWSGTESLEKTAELEQTRPTAIRRHPTSPLAQTTLVPSSIAAD